MPPDRMPESAEADLLHQVAALKAQIAALEHESQTYREEIKLQTEQLLSAQVEVEASRDRFANLYELAPLPYVTLSANGIVDDINLTGAGLLQCDRKAIIGMPFIGFIVAADRRSFLEHLRCCRAGCSPWPTDLRVEPRSGPALPVELLSTRALEPESKNLQFRTVLVDLTARKAAEGEIRALNTELEARVRQRTSELEQANAALKVEVQERRSAEQALRASEQHFRHLADAIPQLVWIADAEGRIEYLNHRWFDLTGLTGDDALAPDALRSVLHPDDVPRLEQAWQQARDNGEPLTIQYRIRDHRTGQYVWHLGLAVSIRDAQTIVRWFGTSTDISAQKGLEQSLQTSSRRKDEFLAMLGHELRNPLAACANAMALMQLEDNSSQEVVRSRQIIARQLDTMTRLIDDLLDVSRVVQNKINLRRKPLDLAQVVYGAASVVEALVHARRHTLSISVPDEPVIVDADPTRIEQVLVNLLTNAARYTPPEGRIEVELSAEQAGPRIVVRDTGEGIAPELIGRVFDLFVQGERSADRVQGGLGIGLTMVKSLVELHGGTIEARSQGRDQGSEFTMKLPWPATRSDEVFSADPGFADVPLPARINRRLLVVEDNADVARSLASLLERLGLRCQVVHDGPAALTAVEKFRPDVVLMDIGLPGMDGYEVARRVRQLHDVRQPMLIALSGYGLPDNRREGREAGFDHYLVKPVLPSKLYSLVRGLELSAGS